MFQGPRYLGLAALDECLLFMPIEQSDKSLYAHLAAREDGLLTDSAVCGLRKLADGRIRVDYRESVSFFVCGPITACRQAGQAFTRSA